MIDPGPYLEKYSFIPIVTGPTASGKSAIALELCRMTGGELISADSMQIYRGLDIGTAKDSPEELAEIRHHMTDIIDPGESFSVYDYDYGVEDDAAVRDAEDYFYSVLEKEGRDSLYAILTDTDPEAAELIHPNNVRRVVRALAVGKATGVRFSEKNRKSKLEGPSFNFKAFMPDMDRAVIYDRINRRVDIMMQQGLEQEARSLYENGKAKGTTCFQAIGYKEFEKYFSGEEDLEQTAYKIKLGSRHYAKRQLTWFRQMGEDIRPVPSDDIKKAAGYILSSCKMS